MSNFISLDQAKQLTSLYRKQKENILKPEFQGKDILSICETFDGAQFTKVLAQPDCVSLRIYYGMSDDMRQRAIIVGVNSNGEDIIPIATTQESTTDGDSGIIEEGALCPPACPPASPLYP